MAEFVMPSLGADMEAGTLVLWRTEVGARVERGDIIAEVDTDKGVIEVEVFESGVVEKLLVTPGTKVPVGTPLAIIGNAVSAPEPPPRVAPPEPLPEATSLHALASFHAPRTRISPSARRLARELGVDAAAVAGTGPGGAVTRSDIAGAASAKPPAPPAAVVPSVPKPEATSRMRQAVAAAMARSNREIPHYYVTQRLSFAPALEWLERANAERSPAERLVYGVLLLKAVALALHDFPELNARWENDALAPSPEINVGMAISLREGGLVIPAIAETDRLSLDQLMQKLRDLVERARRGQLRSGELTNGTITLTSLGERGVESVAGVIYPPQTALVGFGAPLVRPWVENGLCVVRPVLEVTLAADHRASDGHRGARFLREVDELLSEPERLAR